MPDEQAKGSDRFRGLIERLMGPLGEFGGKVHEAQERCREKYRRIEPEPRNRLRIMIDGLMAMLAEAVTTPIASVNEVISYQISLSASFIRTHFVLSDLILEGHVVEAFVLLRKQLETLARLNELDSKPLAKLHGKPPNIQNALQGGAGRIYGDLSEVSHFATPRVGELLHIIENGPAFGPSLLPVYSEQVQGCMDLCQFIAIYFELFMIEKLKDWYTTKDRTDLVQALNLTIANALEAGVIREPEDEPKGGK